MSAAPGRPKRARSAVRSTKGFRTSGPSWSPLPTGEFTGIHWSAPGAIDGEDPYLAWAEADRFAGYRVEPQGKPPKWLPIVIQLSEQADVPALVRLAIREGLISADEV